MKALLLGGTGAIGTYLVDILDGDDRIKEVAVTTRQMRTPKGKVRFIQGDAKSDTFLRGLFRERWDVIVDFMSYKTEEFQQRAELLLSATDHYFFLSSSRVYGDEEHPIRETSPLLVDCSKDKAFLATDAYGLAKARQEKILRAAGGNFTIIRPYITYGDYRLQLGVMEKEEWLLRALSGKPILFPEEGFRKRTTLSNGYDVASAIHQLFFVNDSMGEAYHIAADECLTWEDVFKVYQSTVKEKTGVDISVKLIPTADFIRCRYPYLWEQLVYDRLFDRHFDNSKLKSVINLSEFVSPVEGIRMCLSNFLDNPKWRGVDYRYEALKDRFCGIFTPPVRCGVKQFAKYIIGYVTK